MGLYIQSLEEIRLDITRSFFIYLLDYGWSEPFVEAFQRNFEQMASVASKQNAVVVRGTHRIHFDDEVLSYHNING